MEPTGFGGRLAATRFGGEPRPALLVLATLIGLALWWRLYRELQPISEWITAQLPLARTSHAAEAIAFFLYDVPKVFMLLVLIVFVMGVVRSWFSPEKTRALLAGRREGVGNVLSAGLGHSDAFLLLLCRAAVHWLRVSRSAPRHDPFPFSSLHPWSTKWL